MTTIGVEVTIQLPLDAVTVYDPLWLTVMDWVVAPFDHTFPVVAEDVKTTVPPEQNVVGPLALMVGAAGNGLTVTTVGVEVALQLPLDDVTVYDPLW